MLIVSPRTPAIAIGRAKLFAFGLFLFGSIGVFVYHTWWVAPVKACEAKGAWWDAQDHECAIPVPIWRITGRLPTKVVAPTAPAATAPAKP